MPNVYINGVKYHYAAGVPRSEPAAAVILVHGAGGNHRHWDYQTAALGECFLTLAVDLPGHGLSAGKPAGDISRYTDFLLDFAKHVVGAPFFLAGPSMGGAITLDFALRYPGQLKGLLLVATGAKLRAAPAMLEIFGSGEHFLPLIDLAYGSGTDPKLLDLARQELKDTDPATYHSDFQACNNFDVMDRLQDIVSPTLVLGASEDRLTPVKYSRYLAEKIRQARLEIVEGSGHMVMLEKPAEVNSHIKKFVNC
ncbi:MAG: alpha/beta hydrolase [Firmicutes bacterium]|nr:alpha/beta hydrolase [Bacillota bacterium]